MRNYRHAPVRVVDAQVRVVDAPVRVVGAPVRVVDAPRRTGGATVRVWGAEVRVEDAPMRVARQASPIGTVSEHFLLIYAIMAQNRAYTRIEVKVTKREG